MHLQLSYHKFLAYFQNEKHEFSFVCILSSENKNRIVLVQGCFLSK